MGDALEAIRTATDAVCDACAVPEFNVSMAIALLAR